MAELELHIAAMGCRTCVRMVSARLRDVDGVQMVRADARTRTLTVVGDATLADVTAALAGTPYRPRTRDTCLPV